MGWRRLRNQGGVGGNQSWRGSGQSVSYNVLQARNMNQGACELGQVGKVVLLMGGPVQINSKQSMGERLEAEIDHRDDRSLLKMRARG